MTRGGKALARGTKRVGGAVHGDFPPLGFLGLVYVCECALHVLSVVWLRSCSQYIKKDGALVGAHFEDVISIF